MLQAKIKAKEDGEIRVKEEEEKQIQLELSKGDELKIEDLINDLNNVKSKYIFESDKNIVMYTEVGQLLDGIVYKIRN